MPVCTKPVNSCYRVCHYIPTYLLVSGWVLGVVQGTYARIMFVHVNLRQLLLLSSVMVVHANVHSHCAGGKYCGSTKGRALCVAHPSCLLQVPDHLWSALLRPQHCLLLVRPFLCWHCFQPAHWDPVVLCTLSSDALIDSSCATQVLHQVLSNICSTGAFKHLLNNPPLSRVSYCCCRYGIILSQMVFISIDIFATICLGYCLTLARPAK